MRSSIRRSLSWMPGWPRTAKPPPDPHGRNCERWLGVRGRAVAQQEVLLSPLLQSPPPPVSWSELQSPPPASVLQSPPPPAAPASLLQSPPPPVAPGSLLQSPPPASLPPASLP